MISYEALHDLMGSDHRPVVLKLQVDIPRYEFNDLESNMIGFLQIKHL